MTNGELLRRASGRFDVFVTGDQNLRHQQNLSAIDFGIVVVAARDNRVATISALAPKILDAIERVGRGDVLIVKG